MTEFSNPVGNSRRPTSRLSTIKRELSLVCLASPKQDYPAETGSVGDVPSEVLACGGAGSLLVTSQSSINVIAVATFAGIPALIVTSGRLKAREEEIGLYTSVDPTFDIAVKLASLGVAGHKPDCCASRAGEAS